MKDVLTKKLILFISALAISLTLGVYYNENFFASTLSSPLVIPAAAILIPFSEVTTKVETNYPLRLKIPNIGVDAAIEYVGLTAAGEMDVPKSFDNVAWFSLGFQPGAEGSAVMAGHFDDEDGKRAIFYNLQDLNKGDKLFVEDVNGGVIVFVVREIRVYDSDAFSPEVFISSEGKHLNLITCTGSWNSSLKSYSERLVVFTDIYSF